ncbi:MAG: SxtJ family membrane protein [Candidatus Promineifilaceae bacterium]
MFEELKHIDSSVKKLRDFGRMVGLVVTLIGLFQYLNTRPLAPYFLGVGIFLIIFGFVAPTLLKPLYLVWMSIAVVMGFIMTRVILTLLYFGVLTPIAFLARLSGTQFMTLKPDPTQASYWNERPQKKASRESYEKQF